MSFILGYLRTQKDFETIEEHEEDDVKRERKFASTNSLNVVPFKPQPPLRRKRANTQSSLNLSREYDNDVDYSQVVLRKKNFDRTTSQSMADLAMDRMSMDDYYKRRRSLKPQLSHPPSLVAATRSSSPHPLKSAIKNDPNEKPEKPEKEKKKKSISSSRQKKFYRHFQQLSIDDENVINYFSCALVSDILLQGHLYITNNYFAFYSNVFGYVTKLLIPIVSVTNISKEKTAKIIPNAVGVTTSEDRHVFASFISREAAFRLMISIWRPVPTAEVEDIITKVPDVEQSECSIEDDSSCSISGNESSSQVKERKADIDNRLSEDMRKITAIDGPLLIVEESPPNTNTSSGNNPEKLASLSLSASSAVQPTTAIDTTTTTNSINTTSKITSKLKQLQLKIFPNFQFLHLGVLLVVVLALFSCFLMYRIHLIQTKTFSFRPEDFQLGNEKNGYAEVFKWQKQLQEKSTEDAHVVLSTNLEQIAQVRKSLQTLSDLLHDTTKKYYSQHSDGGLNDDANFVNDKT